MQREEIIDVESLGKVLAAAYQGNPVVSLAYAAFNEDLLSFPTLNDLEAHIAAECAAGRSWPNLVLHYPETNGLAIKRRIALDPERCGGATFRYAMEGWGLIQLQIRCKDTSAIKCRLAANTERRALAWAPTFPELGDPLQWNWRAVERHARRLIRVLRRSAAP